MINYRWVLLIESGIVPLQVRLEMLLGDMQVVLDFLLVAYFAYDIIEKSDLPDVLYIIYLIEVHEHRLHHVLRSLSPHAVVEISLEHFSENSSSLVGLIFHSTFNAQIFKFSVRLSIIEAMKHLLIAPFAR